MSVVMAAILVRQIDAAQQDARCASLGRDVQRLVRRVAASADLAGAWVVAFRPGGVQVVDGWKAVLARRHLDAGVRQSFLLVGAPPTPICRIEHVGPRCCGRDNPAVVIFRRDAGAIDCDCCDERVVEPEPDRRKARCQ